MATLELIARETGKSLEYFKPNGADRVRVAAENLVAALVFEARAAVDQARQVAGVAGS